MLLYRLLVFFILCFSVNSFGECDCNKTVYHKGITIDEIGSYFTSFDIEKHDKEFKGHTVEKHVSKSTDWLEGRLSGNRHQRLASSFIDAETTNHVIKTIVSENQEKIKDWLMNDEGKEKLVLMKKFPSKIGIMMRRIDKKVEDCDIGFVILKRTHRGALTFYIVTSYPVAKANETLEELPSKNTKSYNIKQAVW